MQTCPGWILSGTRIIPMVLSPLDQSAPFGGKGFSSCCLSSSFGLKDQLGEAIQFASGRIIGAIIFFSINTQSSTPFVTRQTQRCVNSSSWIIQWSTFTLLSPFELSNSSKSFSIFFKILNFLTVMIAGATPGDLPFPPSNSTSAWLRLTTTLPQSSGRSGKMQLSYVTKFSSGSSCMTELTPGVS